MKSSVKAAPFSSDFYCQSSFFYRGNGGGLEEIHQPTTGFHHEEAVDLSPTPADVTVDCTNLHYATYDTVMDYGLRDGVEGEAGCLDTGQSVFQKGITIGAMTTSVNGYCGNTVEKCCDSVSAMADNSRHTDTSTDIDTDDKTQLNGVQQGKDCADQSKAISGNQKTLRRQAQNREAARKSRLRRKAYVQQLENSRLRLAQLEDELKSAPQQGYLVESGVPVDHSHKVSSNGTFAFELEYARWIEEHERLISDLRSAVDLQLGDTELRVMVDAVMAHYDEIFRLKGIGSKADVFHMLSGIWTTPAERFFMWLGGFRSSELLRVLRNHLDPLTDQQFLGICNLQQSSLQAEEALSQGMEALQQSLMETLSSTASLVCPNSPANVADYMGQMAVAMSKLSTLETFLRQADLLRQQTLQQLHRILTTRQSARAFLVIHDYVSRLRALNSLWLARPED
ncbi:PREDICTED: transcription factor PERIANTHIA-like [Tarenaya hassleriana]|uniref:transcription factor PERIANTHIA-like n=1 Tax=Tarenaya hassleriana TaxID=28532 RepID=UPI00053C6392|nr:PREDICTED: transcription factor PERIANTHIA-like [Tarenaya hassleriana]